MYEMTFEQWLKMAPSALTQIFQLLLPWAIGILLVINWQKVLLFIAFIVRNSAELLRKFFAIFSFTIKSSYKKHKIRQYQKLPYEKRKQLEQELFNRMKQIAAPEQKRPQL